MTFALSNFTEQYGGNPYFSAQCMESKFTFEYSPFCAVVSYHDTVADNQPQ